MHTVWNSAYTLSRPILFLCPEGEYDSDLSALTELDIRWAIPSTSEKSKIISYSITFDATYWMSSWTVLDSNWFLDYRSLISDHTIVFPQKHVLLITDLIGSLSVVSLDGKYTMTEINAVDIRRAICLFPQWTSTILKRINRNSIRTPHQISTVSSSSTTRLDLTSVHYRRLAPFLSSSSHIIQILFRGILSDWNVQKSTGTWPTSK